MKEWSSLSNIVIRRTYSRNDFGKVENWNDIVERVIRGNVRGFNVSENEINRLRYFMLERKAMPAGRGLWFSGSPMHEKLGGAALTNCWFLTCHHWQQLVIGQDLLMLGGGVGMSVEHRFVSKLPKIKKGVIIKHELTKDADFIVPDSREGWNELIYRVLEAFFVTGKSFSYSTICVRPYGEPIKGFGGTASGAGPLIRCVDNLQDILHNREGKAPRPLDCSDLMCSIGEMVVMGNVRRSAILILGDAWDKDYLKAKRWDLASIPSYRAMANFSVVCDDIDDLHPLYWKTYEAGEAFGLFNRANVQKYGRMGEEKLDSATGVNPCLTGDTLIYVADGRGNVPIKQLVDDGVDIPVFCYDSNKNIAIRYMRHPRKTGFNQKIMKVTFDDGSAIRVTGNHKFLLGSGNYIEAKDLVSGDSVKTITRYKANIKEIFNKANSKSQDYWWLANGQRKTCGEHKYIAEFHKNTKINTGFIVHHIDYNALNNDPTNLKILSKKEHDDLHAKDMIGKRNPYYRMSNDWRDSFHRNATLRAQGLNNPRYCGYTNDDLKEFAIELTRTLGRRFSTDEWKKFAKTRSLPTKFSKWRENHLGNVKGLSLWAANFLGYIEQNYDPRLLKTYNSAINQGYDVEIINGDVILNKNCEGCNSPIKVRYLYREIGYCSSSCSNRSRDKNIYLKSATTNKVIWAEKRKALREKQINLFNELKFNLSREPMKKEWKEECKKVGISTEIGRQDNPWFQFLEDASNYNHRVISVEFDGCEDVYNGTVDEFHNFFVGAFESVTKSNKQKFNYINNLQCGEATLENGEGCNLQELFLPNLEGENEFAEAGVLMHRWGKRVACEQYHHAMINDIVHRNCRIGTGITGCLDAPELFRADVLDRIYALIQKENTRSSIELNIPESIRTTLAKPSGTLSFIGDCKPGVHGDLSRYSIRRIRFGANDPLIKALKEAGHHIEPVQRFDNTLDHTTLVVDFYRKAPDGTPCVDEGFDTWKQLDTLLFTQKHWADQAVSVTVYYERPEIPQVKEWLSNNLCNIKTISFLCHNDHGFKQAPIEAITKQEYERLTSKIKPIDLDDITSGQILDNLECEGGYCPIR